MEKSFFEYKRVEKVEKRIERYFQIQSDYFKSVLPYFK